MSKSRSLTLVVGTGLAAVAVIAAARLTPSGDSTAGGLPTESEALAFLAQTYERAKQTADAFAFCAESKARAICINQYIEVGSRAAVPSEPPKVVGVRTTGSTRVLTVCGVDGLGKTYRADFPIERDRGRLLAILDVFWDSKTYSTKAPGEPIQASPRPQASFSC